MATVIIALSTLALACLFMIRMSAWDQTARRLPVSLYRAQAWRGAAARRAATRHG
ncbi:MAG: hypothetical protein IT563_21345 [Alphaproteobacteria bacterium]|nr:hypothetical protein [Alphaproteobacteria bacterium]MCC7049486.1 hypothetical protein [Alphaproteobacteria bacterium]